MVIYGDVLFISNMFIDYLLISLTAVILKCEISLLTQIISAVLGGASSFYIFVLTESIFIDIALRIAFGFIIVWVAFFGKKLRLIINATLIFSLLSFALGGILDFLSTVFRLESVKVNNTFFYVGISPILLIILTVIFYFGMLFYFRIKKNRAGEEHCAVNLILDGRSVNFTGLLDSGNAISDPISNSEVFIICKKGIKKLLGEDLEPYAERNKTRYRIIPVETVTGKAILSAIRIDKGEITVGKRRYRFKTPIIAVSEHLADDDYELIIPKSIVEEKDYETI